MIRALFAAAAITVAAVGSAPAASADPVADLLGMIPAGYAFGCRPVDSERPVALTAVDCDNRVFPGGGPAPGRYILYGDPETLERDFVAAVQEWLVPVPCPGREGLGPTRWGPPDATAGSIACGTGKEPAYLAWTDDSGPYFGMVVGRDLGELMNWWVTTVEQPTD